MTTSRSTIFSFDNFEGTLELLLYLIQKEEIDICTIVIKKLTNQFMQVLEAKPEIEINSETLSLAASLLLMKSQKLLPQTQEGETIESDFGVEMLQGLLEYFVLKERAQILTLREEEQQALFPRNPPSFQKEPSLGLEGVEIDKLHELVRDLLKKAASAPKKIVLEEQWQISHKIDLLRSKLACEKKLPFGALFDKQMSRIEIVVIFLALLEMIKQQEVLLVQENENLYVVAYL